GATPPPAARGTHISVWRPPPPPQAPGYDPLLCRRVALAESGSHNRPDSAGDPRLRGSTYKELSDAHAWLRPDTLCPRFRDRCRLQQGRQEGHGQTRRRRRWRRGEDQRREDYRHLGRDEEEGRKSPRWHVGDCRLRQGGEDEDDDEGKDKGRRKGEGHKRRDRRHVQGGGRQAQSHYEERRQRRNGYGHDQDTQ